MEKKKEMLFLAPFPPHKGGIAYYSEEFIKNAPDNLIIKPVGFKRVFPKILYPGSSIKKREEMGEFPLEIDSLNPFTWDYPSSLNLKEEGIFIISYWTSLLSIPLYFIVKNFKKRYKKWKIILWCHNVEDHRRIYFLENFKKKLFKEADGLIVHSKKAQREVKNFFEKKVLLSFLPIHPLPYGLIEKEKAKEGIGLRKEDKTILFLGTIRKYKGIENLIQIGKILKERDFKFIIAGDLWRECKKYVKDFKELNFITFFGFHSWEEIIKFLSLSDLLLMPYESASGSGILMIAYYYRLPFCITGLEE
ncbi:MAG: glycosyltransferase, partial [Thermoanaerobaculia bacterium]